MSDITHRGWIIAPATIGYDIQHPDFDRENELDWRHGHTDTIEAARIEIDRLLTEDAEWTEAVSILKEGYTPKPPAGGDAGDGWIVKLDNWMTVSVEDGDMILRNEAGEPIAFGKLGPNADFPAGAAHEPFGYWVEQKHADPVLLRKPAYIPEPSDLRTVTPLYSAALAFPAPVVEEKTLSHVIAEAKHNLRLTQGCMECNAEDERRWQDTITWLEGLA